MARLANGPRGTASSRTHLTRLNAGFCIIPVFVIVIIAIGVALYFVYRLGGVPSESGSAVRVDAPVSARSGLQDDAEVVTTFKVDTTGAPAAPEAGSKAKTHYNPDAETAYEALGMGDYDTAVDRFRRALETETDPRARKSYSASLAAALNDLGVQGYKQGEYAASLAYLTEATELALSNGVEAGAVLVNKAVVEIAAGDLRAASQTLDMAGDAPRVSDVRRQLVAAQKRASENEGLTETRSSRFIVRYEGAENAVAGHLIGILLEEAYFKIGADLGYRPTSPLEALLYTEKRFTDVTEAPSWAGAIYDGRIKIPAGGLTERTEALERVVFHEYTHAVVHAISRGRAPTWLNEGLAQYEEGRNAADADAYLRSVMKKMGSGSLPLRAYEGSFMGLSAEGAHTAYMVALSSTAYLIREYGAPMAVRVLGELGAGSTIDEAFLSTIYISYDDFAEGWTRALLR